MTELLEYTAFSVPVSPEVEWDMEHSAEFPLEVFLESLRESAAYQAEEQGGELLPGPEWRREIPYRVFGSSEIQAIIYTWPACRVVRRG